MATLMVFYQPRYDLAVANLTLGKLDVNLGINSLFGATGSILRLQGRSRDYTQSPPLRRKTLLSEKPVYKIVEISHWEFCWRVMDTLVPASQ